MLLSRVLALLPVRCWIEPHHTYAFWDRVERIVSDWCDAYGGLRLRKQWLAENGATITFREVWEAGAIAFH